MQLTTTKTLSDNFYSVRFATTLNVSELELASDFGDPTISMGGIFSGNTITFIGSITDGATITQGSAIGLYISPGIVDNLTTYYFTAGAIDSGATITASTDILFTLSPNTKHLDADFPNTTVFTNSVNAEIFATEAKRRIVNGIVGLRNLTDDFSEEIIITV
jgi:hypothetical protein